MERGYDLYINRCKAYVEYVLMQQQWSGLTKAVVEDWLDNFRDVEEEELCYAYKLLTSLIYFSENDVLDALKEGLYHCTAYKTILKKQIEAEFSLSPNALKNIASDELTKTCFIPLLDSNSPHESGNYITRTLVQQGLISTAQSNFAERLPEMFKTNNYSRLVIVDDCVGSGDQLRNFWTYTTVQDGGKEVTLRQLCDDYGVEANYLTLFGYDQSIEQLRKDFLDIEIWCVRGLNDTQRVFSDESYIWKDTDERKKAEIFFSDITREVGIPLYGYANLDFAFIMHRTIPDWSLPLFWKENADWKLLMRRKNSRV